MANGLICIQQLQPLRAESDGWIRKQWGQTRCLLAVNGYEIWESRAEGGKRTSFHYHPFHNQTVHVTHGIVEVVSNHQRLVICSDGRAVEVVRRVAHELRFPCDTHFVEIYRGEGSVMDSIERVFS